VFCVLGAGAEGQGPRLGLAWLPSDIDACVACWRALACHAASLCVHRPAAQQCRAPSPACSGDGPAMRVDNVAVRTGCVLISLDLLAEWPHELQGQGLGQGPRLLALKGEQLEGRLAPVVKQWLGDHSHLLAHMPVDKPLVLQVRRRRAAGGAGGVLGCCLGAVAVQCRVAARVLC